MRVLVIDDEDILRKTVRRILEAAGHEVMEAENGRIGLSVFRQSPPDVVLTDIVMPDREGIETIIEIRKLAPVTRIVAMSGASQFTDFLHMAHQLGAAATLPKPFRQQELLDCIEGRSAGRTA